MYSCSDAGTGRLVVTLPRGVPVLPSDSQSKLLIAAVES